VTRIYLFGDRLSPSRHVYRTTVDAIEIVHIWLTVQILGRAN
jgi:hypothetical protein